MNGYTGKVIEVDLSKGEIEIKDIAPELLREYMGGSGLAAKIYLDRYPGDVDPLSPENLMILMTGPLTQTRVPGGNRFAVAARSPLSGLWGEASCGGYLGPELKASGYDGIIFTGASEKPVYLWVHGDQVELRDASDLWGKDTFETIDELKKRAEEDAGKASKVAAVGPAGEKGVSYANICHDKHHFAGRTGMGAVMASKNLKAISVLGVGKKVEYADEDALKKWRKGLMELMGEAITTESLRAFGTNASLEIGSMLGDVPFKNWQLGEWDEGVAELNGPAYSDAILVKGYACWGCPIGCKRIVKVEEGPYQVEEGAGPEYETVCMLGTNLMNDNLQSVAKANEICNRYGMDTITLGETIAVVAEAMEKGLLDPDEVGLEVTWGDPDSMLRLVEMTGNMEGFGKKIALGSRKLAQEIGEEALPMAVEVRGLELPAHDPRGFHGYALSYATSVRGACHCASINLYIEGGMQVPMEDVGLGGPYAEQESEGKGFVTARSQELGQLYNSAVLCVFCTFNYDGQMLLDAVNAVTGFDYSMEELLQVGERIWTIKRGLQFLMGSDKSEDVVPERITTPVEEGAHAGSIPDLDLMLKEFSEVRDLDDEGRPSRAKLESLNLAELADRLGV